MMANKKSPKRKYDSSRRRAQARETKLQIVEAARKLFMKRGYAGATIRAIAQQAGVSQETVYANFKNKRNILSFLMDISIGGDDQPVTLMDRPGPQAVMQTTDQHRQIELFAQDITGILMRVTPVFEIMREAAKSEPEIAELLTHMLEERLDNMNRFVHSVSVHGKLREGIDETEAGEMTWIITSPEVFYLLTTERNWTTEEYIQWLSCTLTRLLLP
jgi:AcrR family transcriptional regulator